MRILMGYWKKFCDLLALTTPSPSLKRRGSLSFAFLSHQELLPLKRGGWEGLRLTKKAPTRPHRLTVRTPGSHPGNWGSIPHEATKSIKI